MVLNGDKVLYVKLYQQQYHKPPRKNVYSTIKAPFVRQTDKWKVSECGGGGIGGTKWTMVKGLTLKYCLKPIMNSSVI